MIVFDPSALVTSLAAIAETNRAAVDAPSAIFQVQSGGLSVAAAAGVSDLESQTPATPDQTFEIGSQTKMMTAVIILQLAEEGLIDLDAQAMDYLPAGLVDGVANADQVTVRQLLNMTSGIANFTEVLGPNDIPVYIENVLADPSVIHGAADALDTVRGVAPTNAPGEAFYYSNTNYLLLGQMIEEITGQPFYDVLQERIFDPIGMTASTGMTNLTDPRLSSYSVDPATGDVIDVTHAPVDFGAEGGGVSTTAEMIAFLKALLVDQTLLSPESLAQMRDFMVTEQSSDATALFGLGLAAFHFDGAEGYLGGNYEGFIGGTLATSSSTFLELGSGTVVSTAVTSDQYEPSAATVETVSYIADDPVWQAALAPDDGVLRIASVSAAGLEVSEGEAGLRFASGGAVLTLDRTLAEQTTDSVTLADGSVLVVGDNSTGTRGDEKGNRIDILRDFAGAKDADNHLIGLGGKDKLTGGNGADMIEAGDGNDKVWGGAGDDRIYGGAGNDRLAGDAGADQLWGDAGRDRIDGGAGDDRIDGGAGNDDLTGGDGADTFVFADLGATDRIRDFTHGVDLIDLSGLASQAADDAFHWSGAGAFSNIAGEVILVGGRGGMQLLADADGDGKADLTIVLQKGAMVDMGDLIL